MSALEIIATVLIGAGLLLAVVAAVGLNRFDGVLMRIHAASKPQTLGLMFVFTGVALVAQSGSLAGFLLVVLLAQMGTVPVASVLVGRAAFRRGVLAGAAYVFDERRRRLADADDGDDDHDKDGLLDDHEGMAHDGEDRLHETVAHPEAAARAMTNRIGAEPEAVRTAGVDIDSLDV